MFTLSHSFDVVSSLPFLSHLVTFLMVSTELLTLGASTQGLVNNTLHSPFIVPIFTRPQFTDETQRVLRLSGQFHLRSMSDHSRHVQQELPETALGYSRQLDEE
jgi:hypothetical protein